MNLISCEECGVVLDADQLIFPKDVYDEEGEIDDSLATWVSSIDRFVRYTSCPVCKEQILDPSVKEL